MVWHTLNLPQGLTFTQISVDKIADISHFDLYAERIPLVANQSGMFFVHYGTNE